MSNTQTDKQNDWKEREVGALWKKTGSKGSYCTGYIVSDELGNKTKQRVIMFSNKTKSNEKSPDFIIYLSNEQAVEPSNTPAAKPKIIKKSIPAPQMQEEEIPDL